MSGTLTPTIAASPTAVQTATGLLAFMAALNGQATDYNVGSQIRTLAEAIGSATEQEGIGVQSLALQALAYGAMSLFGVQQSQPTYATGTVIFATSFPVSAAPSVTQAVPIPSGTLMQTAGGVQFATTAAATLASGTTSIDVGVIATTAGSNGNVSASGITGTPLTSLSYPLYVANGAATGGGSNAGSQSNALAQFTARAAALGLCSPVAIANAVIGVSVSGETVQFGAVYEPWIAAGSGAGSGTAGFTVYVDDGTGTASAGLVAAVQTFLTGSAASGTSGFRPAGVPYTVSATTAVYANVGVTGTLYPGLFSTGTVYSSIVSSIQSYFNALGISPAAAYQPQVAAQAADAGVGAFSSLTVSLYYSGSGTPVAVVSGGVGTRVILGALDISLTTGN